VKKSLNEWEKIVDTTDNYDHYLINYSKKPNGICLGASLYWASDVLREIANDRKTIGLTLMNQHQFYNFSEHIHAIYGEMHAKLEDKSSKLIAEILNSQERFLSTRSNYKLHYSVINGATTKRNIDAMIKNAPSCRNTAIIFSMSMASRVKLIFKNQLYRHAVAILNHEGSVYFFDVNNGVYKLSNHHLFSLQGIAEIIINGFDTSESDLWELDKGTSHIFIRLETSGTINKNIMDFDYLSERVDWGYDSDDDME
jgi:hypothetical protein